MTRRGQSKTMSWVEAMANTLIGYGIAVGAQMVIFPVFDIQVGMTEHLLIGLWFLVISIVRGYLLRRLFNWVHMRFQS